MLGDREMDCSRELECRREKKKVSICEPKCFDPKAYCKWRTSCPIYMLEKEAKRQTG